jgi:acetyl-CoA carboxylase biotin carboxyl carrier protein
MDLTQDDVLQILKFIEESKFDELHLEMGDFKLVVNKRRGTSPSLRPESALANGAESIGSKKTIHASVGQKADLLLSDQTMEDTQGEELGSAKVLEEEGLILINSPMLGTFYRAPKPNDPPFVEVGTVVTEEDTVCIIEVMKLFSSINAGIRGRIAKVCAENGQMVEYNQVLFLVEPEED